MYLLEKRIKKLKIKNIVFAVVAIFNLVFSVYWQFDLVIRYWGDTFTLSHAANTPAFFFWIVVGPLMLIEAGISTVYIGDARFYSSYFEGDLDGYITVAELCDVTGKKETKVRRQLKLFLTLYMKNYSITDDGVKLASKTVTCECVKCGAHIQKREYFTGICQYCGSSDLRARVLTDKKFYSISNEIKGEAKSYDYYTYKNLKTRLIRSYILAGFSLFFIALLLLGIKTAIFRFDDKEYYRSIILDVDKHMQSYELITYDLIETIIQNCFFILGLIPASIAGIKRIGCARISHICSEFFSKCRTPFIKAAELPDYNRVNDSRKLNLVRRSIRMGYLKHCTLEKHSGDLEITLGKKIVKDTCPSCGASITGAVTADYICRYCNNKIMGVVVKK